jgi:hypothetical protein
MLRWIAILVAVAIAISYLDRQAAGATQGIARAIPVSKH